MTPGEPDRHRQTRIYNTLFISVFSTMIGLGIVVPLLPVYAEGMGASGLAIGAIFSGFSLSRAVLMPIIGSVSDVAGRKRFIVAGLLLYTLLSFGYIAADTVVALTAVRIVHGGASAMVLPVAMAYIADCSPKGEEGRYMGTFTVSTFLGMGFGPFLGGVIRDIAGMDAVFLSMAFFSAVSSGICILLLPESRRASVARRSFRASVRHRLIRAVMVFQFMNSFANGTFLVFLPLAAAALLSLSSTVIGIIISLSIFTTALFQRYSGGLAGRYSRPLFVTVGSVIVAGALIAVPLMGSALLMLVAALLIGAGTGIAIPSATAITTVAGREIGQGAAMGAYNTASSAGMIVAPIVSGVIMDALGLAPVFYFSGTASLLAVLGFRYVIRRESTL